jgi:phosphate transport system substrate-binding protein
MGSLAKAWLAGLRHYYPELRVAFDVAGSRQAARGLIMGGVEIAALSRELTEEEKALFILYHGYAPTVIPVARDAVAVYVHHDNPISGLTLPQLDAIFSTTRLAGYPSNVSTWRDVDLSNEWAKANLHLYGPDLTSSTSLFFRETVLLGGAFKPEMRTISGSAELVSAIVVDPMGIGYSPIAYNQAGVEPVPLASTSADAFVSPSMHSVQDGSYPLSRLLYLYVNRLPQVPLPRSVQEFLRYVRSRNGQEAVVTQGFFPLPPEQFSSLAQNS